LSSEFYYHTLFVQAYRSDPFHFFSDIISPSFDQPFYYEKTSRGSQKWSIVNFPAALPPSAH
ncbi:MAG: hypothetical protein K6G05_09975, partial [Lachnospiraceae bacterium]|nr:hypothetical protein [Lachnospiraceae bacterium]